MTSCHAIYYEIMSWSMALSLVGIYIILKILFFNENIPLNLFFLSLVTSMSFLNRLTFSIPLGLILLFLLVKYVKEIPKKNILLILLPLMISGGFQMWYNHARFGSVYKFFDQVHYGNAYPIKYQKENKRLMDGLHNLKFYKLNRVKENFLNYFSYNKNVFTKYFPYVQYYVPKISVWKNYSFIEPILSLLILCPWLLLFSLIGLTLIISFESLEVKIFSGLFSIQVMLMLCFFALVQRYTSEFMPFFVFSYFFYLKNYGKIKFQKNNIYLPLKCALCILGIYVTVFSSISWRIYRYSYTPKKYKTEMKSSFNKVDNLVSRYYL